MPKPTPRHRRKAGSGPPAAALIAWIGTDRREPDLRPSSNSRSARNVVASVALACGAVLAVTVSTVAGVLGPRDATTAPTIPQDHPVPANQVGSNTVLPPVPAAAQPAVVRSIPVAPATENAAENVPEDVAGNVAEAAQPAVAPPAPKAPEAAPRPVTERQAAVPRVRSQPDAPAKRRNADVPRTSPSTRDSRSSQRHDRDSTRGERSGLGSTLKRTTDSVESGVGLR